MGWKEERSVIFSGERGEVFEPETLDELHDIAIFLAIVGPELTMRGGFERKLVLEPAEHAHISATQDAGGRIGHHRLRSTHTLVGLGNRYYPNPTSRAQSYRLGRAATSAHANGNIHLVAA